MKNCIVSLILFLLFKNNAKAQISHADLDGLYKWYKNENKNQLTNLYDESFTNVSQSPTMGISLPKAVTKNAVIGVVNFLADRSKDEIISLFMDRFGKFIDSTKTKYYSPLFPSTIGAIDIIGENLYNYKSFVPIIRQAISSDLKLIPENLEQIIPFINGIKPIQRAMLVVALRNGSKLLNGMPIDEVVRGINIDLEELEIISLDQKALTPTLLSLYSFSSVNLANIEYVTNSYKSNIGQIHPNIYEEYYKMLEEIKVYESSDDPHRLYQSTIRLLKLLPNQNENYEYFVKYFEKGINIIYNIRQNNFNLAILDVIYVLNIKKNDKNINQVVKYLNFMASFTAAKNSEEINSLLKDTALPVGSYRLKRSSDTYTFINGYTGFKYSYDRTTKTDFDKLSSYGLSAPVGVSFGWWKNVGFFIPLVDLGQYLSYANNNEVEDFPEVTLSNIFAPGGFVEWHIPSIFLTVSGGYSVGPWSRMEVATEESNLYHGLQGNFKIDIPLYQLYNKENIK